MSTHGFVGDLLIRTGVVDAAGITRASKTQATHGTTLGRKLAGLGLAEETVVAQTIATALRLEFLDEQVTPAPDVATLVPEDFCRKRNALPLTLEGKSLRVAVIDPMDYSVLEDMAFRSGRKTVGVVVTESWLIAAFARLYCEGDKRQADKRNADKPASYDMLGDATPAGQVEASSDDEYEIVDPATLAKGTNLPPIVRLVNQILSTAAAAGASDVHIEPHEMSLQVRQRVDGLLQEVLTIPKHLKDATISRLKIISGMDIAERRKPQDGRSRLKFEGNRIDLRVSTLPTQFGEKVVIRLLNSARAIMPLRGLGFSPDNLRLMEGFLSQPQGMILVTGPTGSGKTSSLYAALNSIKSSTNNIVTLEDPIEFQLPGVNQMQINAKAGVTFAAGLRSILRQDPNVILVGEIRDRETAEIALQAAQTGHLLLSTLHTNDAASTITRLFDLGIQPFLAASSLIGITAQRLVRRPCAACAVLERPSADSVEKIGGAARLRADGKWMVGKGCEKCGGSGTKGRMAIHEVLFVNDEMRELISARESDHAIRKAARRAGMRTLLEDGIEKAAQGLTTIDEVLRVVSHDERDDESEETPPATHAVSPTTVLSVPTPAVIPPPVAAAAPAAVSADKAGAPDQNGRKRVLIVEDSPTIVSVVKYFLELEGFEVLVANDGHTGLEMALNQRPDIIVSDVNMPGMTGVDMVKALRAETGAAGNVRILMLTSEDTVDSETKALAAGADDYIVKPVEPRRLAARVKALLARAQRAA
jgi:type IV pilus assembly protein PilB